MVTGNIFLFGLAHILIDENSNRITPNKGKTIRDFGFLGVA